MVGKVNYFRNPLNKKYRNMAASSIIGRSCIKYFLCAMNIFPMLIGIGLIVLGLLAFEELNTIFFFLVSYRILNANFLILIVGLFILHLTLLGYYGIINENIYALLVFTVSFSIILAFEAVAVISLYGLQDYINDYISHSLNSAFYWNHSEGLPGFETSINTLQTSLQCCGAMSKDDWTKYNMTYPDSCCHRNDLEESNYGEMSCIRPFAHACVFKFTTFVRVVGLVSHPFLIWIAMILLIPIVMTSTLIQSIRCHNIDQEKKRCELRDSLLSNYQRTEKSDPETTFPVIFTHSDFPSKTPIA